MKRTVGEKIFDHLNTVCMILFGIVTIYPFIYILAISLNDGGDAMRGGIYFYPRVFSLDSYKLIFSDPELYSAATVSILRTIIGTVSALVCTTMVAYAFTKKDQIPGGKLMYLIFIITMFINGGLIPTYMLYRWIGIYDTFAVYVLPGLVGAFYMVIMRTFFMQIPKEMQESAVIDGANDFQIYLRIIIPLSAPILATIGLFVAVKHWNSWYDTLFFTSGRKGLITLQYKLMEIINRAEASQLMSDMEKKLRRYAGNTVTTESVKMAITIVSTVPILCVYPFLQKYFVKGIMIGAIKG